MTEAALKTMLIVALLGLVALTATAQSKRRITLAEAENLALTTSSDLRIQKLQNEAASERNRLSIRDYLPQLQLGFTTENEINQAAPDSDSDQLSVTLQQPLYNGGRTAMQHALNRLQLLVSRHSFDVAREDLLDRVWQQFYQVLALQAQLAVKRSSVEASRKELAIARSEKAQGMIREIDLVDAELAESNQEVDLQSTEVGLEQARYALKKTLGLAPGEAIDLEGKIDLSYKGLDLDKPATFFIPVAMEHNLDLETDRFKERQAEAQVRIANSQYLPQVSAVVGVTVSGQHLPLQTPGLTLGLNISFPEPEAPIQTSFSESSSGPLLSTQSVPSTVSPLYSESSSGPLSMTRSSSFSVTPFQSVTGYLDRADARFKLEQTRETTKSLVEDISFEVAQSISQYSRQQKRIGLERRSVRLEKEKLAIMREELTVGEATYVDYIKEETQGADLETQLLSDILTLVQDERSFEKLLGIEPGSLAGLLGENHNAP